MYPDKDWNYAIVTGEDAEKALKVEKGAPMSLLPWDIDNVPLKITVKARKVNGWKLAHAKKIKYVENLYFRPWIMSEKEGKYTFTPRFPSKAAMEKNGLGEEETITLVPYGAAKLRLTIFPKI